MSQRAQEFLKDLFSKRLTREEEHLFPAQDAFVDSKAQFIAALCTRRAGKSSGFARKFKKTMDQYPGCLTRYIALTRDSAKDILWTILQEMDERLKWKAKFIESNLTMLMPNESRLKLYGADMRNFIRRLRGAKCPANAVDESQEFGDHLSNLIDDVLTPSMIDYPDSWLGLGGTPGPIPRGTFYDITTQKIGGYELHQWSLHENPYLKNTQEFLTNLKQRKQWDDNNPTYLREYQGKWVLDRESLLIRYDSSINHYDTLPAHNWIYILGIDIGHKDADALAVLAWSERSSEIYLVDECITARQDISELETQIKIMLKTYDISKIVMDEGGLGKKIAEEFRRRRSIPVQPAEKQRKMENVAFLNDWLRLGNFKAKKTSRFAIDSEKVQIDHDKSTPDKIAVKKGYHSDIIDSVLYAFKESPAFTYQKQEDKPKYGTKQWAEEEVTEMERAAEEFFQAEEANRLQRLM